ncbi:MAG TPA: 50S ribosomal protein L25/general stress protein Ctc [Propionibacteriaceae bacterium]|nr:50S ribosomal protein L25/general stress protein Ctc [Propionibacteriaceae bacterium]
MADQVTLSATPRSEFGKGAARRLRRAHQVPAVLYGHGTEPVHISLPGHETLLALRVANVLLEIDLEGGKKQLALPKQVQKDPVTGFIEHVDLVVVRRGEKVNVQVPLVLVGEHSADVMVVMDQNTILLEAEATHIPEHIEIDVNGLEVGHNIAAKDLKLPEGAVFHGSPDDLILSAHATPSQESLDAELGAALGGAEEPEVATEPEASNEE